MNPKKHCSNFQFYIHFYILILDACNQPKKYADFCKTINHLQVSSKLVLN